MRHAFGAWCAPRGACYAHTLRGAWEARFARPHVIGRPHCVRLGGDVTDSSGTVPQMPLTMDSLAFRAVRAWGFRTFEACTPLASALLLGWSSNLTEV